MNKDNKRLLVMDLQTFATKDDEPADTSTEEGKAEDIDNNKEDKTFTQEDVNSIVQTRVSRASKGLIQEIEDLKEQLKTQNLSAEEKKSYEEQKRQKLLPTEQRQSHPSHRKLLTRWQAEL